MALLPWPARQNPLRTGYLVRPFITKALPAAPDVTLPDSAAVRHLLALDGASMLHFELSPERVS